VPAGTRVCCSTQGMDGMQRFLDGYPQWVRYVLAGIGIMALSVAFSLSDETSLPQALITAGVRGTLIGIFFALYKGWRPGRRRPKDHS